MFIYLLYEAKVVTKGVKTLQRKKYFCTPKIRAKVFFQTNTRNKKLFTGNTAAVAATNKNLSIFELYTNSSAFLDVRGAVHISVMLLFLTGQN